ncbi:glycosyltransferase [Pedobacter sp. N23S346]|uniref:glycosyltransferase n=1 Tax=Pedobacter sp. N23S346 TaxID=3402750 RepID=UPI003ACEC8D4
MFDNIQMQSIKLSICIPTYNRAVYLRDTIQSIVCQKVFIDSDQVEIIISDNCSDDNTKQVANEFTSIYGEKILYYRNDINIVDKNFELAMRRGNGLFLKLNNDTLKHKDGSLQKMLSTIDSNLTEKKILFFSNGESTASSLECKNLDEFVSKVSYNSNWIGAFGLWKSDFDEINDFNRYSHLLLTQTDVLFRLISTGKKVQIYNEKIFEVLEVQKKGGYDLITVFVDNYTFILDEFINKGQISPKTYEDEVRKLVLKFLAAWIARIKVYPETYHFKIDNWKERVKSFCKNRNFLFTEFLVKYTFSRSKLYVKKQLKHYVLH